MAKLEYRQREHGIDVKWSVDAVRYFLSKNVYLRYPWHVRGVFRRGQMVHIPQNIVVEPYSNMPQGGFISAGAFSYCRSTVLDSDFKIARYGSIAPGVSLADEEHPLDRVSTHVFTFRNHMKKLAKVQFGQDIKIFSWQTRQRPPQIGSDVWLGRNAVIKRGVTVGNGAVVAANAFVTKDVPDYAIVGGLPARLIRYRFDERTIERLLELRWWRFRYTDFQGLDPRNIDAFIDGLAARIADGVVEELPDQSFTLADDIRRVGLRLPD